MELVIILAVAAVAVWYFFFRDKETVQEAISPAPYKVDITPVVETTSAPVAEVKPAEVTAPITEVKAPAKAKRTPKPKAEPTKAPAKAKTAAKPKAPTKAKAPAKAKVPKMTVAK